MSPSTQEYFFKTAGTVLVIVVCLAAVVTTASVAPKYFEAIAWLSGILGITALIGIYNIHV